MLAAFSSQTLIYLGVVLLILYFALLAVGVAYNVVRDARRRSPSILFAIFAFLLAFIPPFLGALIYLVIRPPRTLDEERSLALEEQLLHEPAASGPEIRPCPTCGRDIEEDFVICPYCRTQFARRCGVCERTLRLGWPVCPYCASEVGVQSLPQAHPRSASR
ncbi:MAG TPA: zinc ribbon domain-containing protein [Candidatus Binatia bacterium]|nr:zinc ribbon domain-containing protein [Candidatus Binatia bacterium]